MFQSASAVHNIVHSADLTYLSLLHTQVTANLTVLDVTFPIHRVQHLGIKQIIEVTIQVQPVQIHIDLLYLKVKKF